MTFQVGNSAKKKKQSLLKKGKSDEDLVGVELDLQQLTQGLDVGGRRLAAVPGGSASLFFSSYFPTVEGFSFT